MGVVDRRRVNESLGTEMERRKAFGRLLVGGARKEKKEGMKSEKVNKESRIRATLEGQHPIQLANVPSTRFDLLVVAWEALSGGQTTAGGGFNRRE